MPIHPSCNHRGKSKSCRLLTVVDVKNFHAAFYAIREKQKQDSFLLKYCNESLPVRSRNRKKNGSSRSINYNYFVTNEANNRIQVCKETFLNILGITKHRVIECSNILRNNAKVPVQTRGGNRKEKLFNDKLNLSSSL